MGAFEAEVEAKIAVRQSQMRLMESANLRAEHSLLKPFSSGQMR